MRFPFHVAARLVALLAAGAAESADRTCVGPDFRGQAAKIIGAYLDAHALSGAALVAENGHVLLRRSFGFADRSWEIHNTPQTRFRIASLGKQFVAAAILQLADQGKIAVDAPISTYLPMAPASWVEVTVKQLLNHTSGIPDYTEAPGFLEGHSSPPRSFEEIFELIRNKPLEFKPGTNFRYDNSGYAVLSHIIENVSGQSVADYLESQIFHPLGMNDTGVDDFGRIVPQLATGYTIGADGWNEAQDLRGVGDLYSTVDDLLRWREGLFGGNVIRPASLRLMTTDWGHGYGFGLVVANAAFSHSGGEPGFRSGLYWYAKEGITSIALSNFDGIQVNDVAKDLATACLGLPVRPAEVKLAPSVLERYVGAYRLSPTETLWIAREGNHLVSRTDGDTPTPIFAKNNHEFFARIRRLQYGFEFDASDVPTALVLRGPAGSVMGRFPRVQVLDVRGRSR